MTRIALCSLVLGGVLAACNDGAVTTRTKGSTSRGSAAQDSGQQVGSTARRSGSRYASDYGDVYEGVTCDAFAEGVAWCDDDFTVAYCSAGTWWLLDCADVGEDYCAEDAFTVDCYSF